MAKPEVHDYKSTGATCALDKDKIQMKELIHDYGKKIVLISVKNERENLLNCEKDIERTGIIILTYFRQCYSTT